jgi:hypothetical protein
MTPRQLIEKHPEWADLPMVVYTSDGSYEHVGDSARVYTNETTDDPDADMSDPATPKYTVLVFDPS